jgi:CDP-paratose 2-epimerase
MKYLITGGCGFLGSNIASDILKKGHSLIIFDSLYRLGGHRNLMWLKNQGEFEFIHGDIRNTNDVNRIIIHHQPDVIFHLAGQVAMTTSLSDPRMDYEVNLGGSFNLLDAVRLYSPDSVIVYSSTNKVYGDLSQFKYEETETRYICIDKPNGFDEKTYMDFHSPYGVSKGSADQYVLDFSRVYGLRAVVFRHSSMYGNRQFASIDQGWLVWFVNKAIEVMQKQLKVPVTISGNGKQVRDLLYVDDCVELYLLAANEIDITNGQVFNIGGGMDNSLSILELFEFLENELSIKMNYINLPCRESDQRVFVADFSKINKLIGWAPKVNYDVGIRKTINWLS